MYSNVREQFRGFRAPWVSTRHRMGTLVVRLASSDRIQPRLQLLRFRARELVRQFRSGSPYTPMVAGDVNGDGYVNDRAFIPDAATTRPPASSRCSTMTAEARECLAKQLGTSPVATAVRARGLDCVAVVSFNPVKVRMPQRATLSFQVSNPLGAADLCSTARQSERLGAAVHSRSAASLRTRIRSATQRYRYEVNQRFGSTISPAVRSVFRSP